MSDDLLKRADNCGTIPSIFLVSDLSARVHELEAERDALRAENERLRLEMQAACTSLCPHGLDIAAQKENAERRLRKYEHHVMTGRSEQHDRLVADNERLRNGYGEIRDMCCRSPRKGLDDRIVTYIDATLADGGKT